jgi:diguanylate cyclase (GGDEF)-like protein
MIDIDNFKQINDVYGHNVGDVAIRGVARAATTETAIVGRLGGEEFAILLEGRVLSEAVEIAERLRLRFAGLRFKTDKETVTLTSSLGVSEWKPGDIIDRLLKRADVALYNAKAGGRNRVVAADSTLMETNHSGSSSIVRSATRLRVSESV